MALAYSAALPYVSGSAVSQLVTGNWRPYVTPPYNDLLVPGTALGVLGAGGFVVILMRKTLSHMLLVAWLSGLLFLANALIVGIPIPDPGRFLWRLTEPLSIMAAILTYSSVKVSRNSKKPIASSSVRDRRDWIRLGVAMLILIIIAFQVTSIVTSTPRYQASEVFYQDDKRIGQWLAVNASSTSVIVNDADVDQTATWVQPFSMKFHFIYRADFAVIVAPANYVEIYKSTAILYESPSDDRVPQIIQRYNITYVIAHTDEIRLFDSSPFFVQTPVFRSGNSALFETKS